MFSVVCLSVCLQAGWGAGPTIQRPGWPIQGPDPTSPDKLGYHYTVKGPSPQTCSNLFNMKHSLSESGQLPFYSNAFLFLTSFSSALNPLAKWIGFEHRIKCHQKIKLHVFFFLHTFFLLSIVFHREPSPPNNAQKIQLVSDIVIKVSM